MLTAEMAGSRLPKVKSGSCSVIAVQVVSHVNDIKVM